MGREAQLTTASDMQFLLPLTQGSLHRPLSTLARPRGFPREQETVLRSPPSGRLAASVFYGEWDQPGGASGGHRFAVAATCVDHCCEYRDSPHMALSRLASAAAIPQISHGRRNKSVPSALPDQSYSYRPGSSPDGRWCTKSPWRNGLTCHASYQRDRWSNCRPWGGSLGARRRILALPPPVAAERKRSVRLACTSSQLPPPPVHCPGRNLGV